MIHPIEAKRSGNWLSPRRLAYGTFAAALLLSACGGGDGEQTDTIDQTPTTQRQREAASPDPSRELSQNIGTQAEKLAVGLQTAMADNDVEADTEGATTTYDVLTSGDKALKIVITRDDPRIGSLENNVRGLRTTYLHQVIEYAQTDTNRGDKGPWQLRIQDVGLDLHVDAADGASQAEVAILPTIPGEYGHGVLVMARTSSLPKD